MFKRITSIALMVLLVAFMSSCILDPEDKKKEEKPPVDNYLDLTEEWHVLHNLVEAYNNTNINEYGNIFDQENFTFFFYPGDVGGDVPEFWFYESEIQSARNMFTAQGGTENNPIISIDITLFDIETTAWTSVTSDDFPGETLRSATVGYTYLIDTQNDVQFITSGVPQAQFIVREIDGKWKLVTWLDLSTGN